MIIYKGGNRMNLDETIKDLKCKNKECFEKNEKYCQELIKNKCTYGNTIIISLLEKYLSIGTVEECLKAIKKQTPKKPIGGRVVKALGYYLCPVCGELLSRSENKFCNKCGQALDWGEDE